jgi:hypothetical protein
MPPHAGLNQTSGPGDVAGCRGRRANVLAGRPQNVHSGMSIANWPVLTGLC